MSRKPGVRVTFDISGPDERGRIHIGEPGNPDGHIVLSPAPISKNYGGHAYDRLLKLLNERRGE